MQEREKLLSWYQKNYRKLPWRESKDPYQIWISEIMCQQTRVAAVIPYYERFMKRFPTLESLANAKEQEVLEQWTGLGYYSRARNIHRAAKELNKTGFPKSYFDLLDYPGIGDYSSRAISSFAFQEKVGVVDGNVVRFFSRLYGAAYEAWTTEGKKAFQEIADEWAQSSPELVNQATMEIGANLCLPQNPHCNICPLFNNCVAREFKLQEFLPLKKQKTKEELWEIEFFLFEKEDSIAITKDHNLPVLKSQFFPPCKTAKLEAEPSRKALFKHAVTHHKFYVFAHRFDLGAQPMREYNNKNFDMLEGAIWVKKAELKKYCQSSMVQKLLES
jgi:A/G-specific adenine glycosylase